MSGFAVVASGRNSPDRAFGVGLRFEVVGFTGSQKSKNINAGAIML